MSAQLKSHTVERTMVLTISNPELRNALGPEIYVAGVEALLAAESNPEIRTVVITGEGAQFCAGGNLHRLKNNRTQSPAVQAASIDGLHGFIEAVRAFPKPVLAAVEGAAAGAGFSLVLACDFVIAARDAVFVMAYANVGLSPDGGASWSLARALPRPLCSQLLMCGDRMGAERLAQLGLVNEVSEPGQALDRTLAMAARLNERAPNVLASIKELLNDAPQMGLSALLPRERDQFVANLHHPNGGIGIQAFLDKTRPDYT